MTANFSVHLTLFNNLRTISFVSSTVAAFRRKIPALFWASLMLLAFGETVLLAYASWQSKDATDWSGDEAHRVLTESPWTKTDTDVTVRWQSALPVRLALFRASGGSGDASRVEALDEYVIAVSGVPSRALPTEKDLARSASLLRGGHAPLIPAKVEVSPGAGERVVLFYFAKNDPIELADKEVEFRLSTAPTEIKKKFALKDMKYQGKLEL